MNAPAASLTANRVFFEAFAAQVAVATEGRTLDPAAFEEVREQATSTALAALQSLKLDVSPKRVGELRKLAAGVALDGSVRDVHSANYLLDTLAHRLGLNTEQLGARISTNVGEIIERMGSPEDVELARAVMTAYRPQLARDPSFHATLPGQFGLMGLPLSFASLMGVPSLISLMTSNSAYFAGAAGPTDMAARVGAIAMGAMAPVLVTPTVKYLVERFVNSKNRDDFVQSFDQLPPMAKVVAGIVASRMLGLEDSGAKGNGLVAALQLSVHHESGTEPANVKEKMQLALHTIKDSAAGLPADVRAEGVRVVGILDKLNISAKGHTLTAARAEIQKLPEADRAMVRDTIVQLAERNKAPSIVTDALFSDDPGIQLAAELAVYTKSSFLRRGTLTHEQVDALVTGLKEVPDDRRAEVADTLRGQLFAADGSTQPGIHLDTASQIDLLRAVAEATGDETGAFIAELNLTLAGSATKTSALGRLVSGSPLTKDDVTTLLSRFEAIPEGQRGAIRHAAWDTLFTADGAPKMAVRFENFSQTARMLRALAPDVDQLTSIQAQLGLYSGLFGSGSFGAVLKSGDGKAIAEQITAAIATTPGIRSELQDWMASPTGRAVMHRSDAGARTALFEAVYGDAGERLLANLGLDGRWSSSRTFDDARVTELLEGLKQIEEPALYDTALAMRDQLFDSEGVAKRGVKFSNVRAHDSMLWALSSILGDQKQAFLTELKLFATGGTGGLAHLRAVLGGEKIDADEAHVMLGRLSSMPAETLSDTREAAWKYLFDGEGRPKSNINFENPRDALRLIAALGTDSPLKTAWAQLHLSLNLGGMDDGGAREIELSLTPPPAREDRDAIYTWLLSDEARPLLANTSAAARGSLFEHLIDDTEAAKLELLKTELALFVGEGAISMTGGDVKRFLAMLGELPTDIAEQARQSVRDLFFDKGQLLAKLGKGVSPMDIAPLQKA